MASSFSPFLAARFAVACPWVFVSSDGCQFVLRACFEAHVRLFSVHQPFRTFCRIASGASSTHLLSFVRHFLMFLPILTPLSRRIVSVFRSTVVLTQSRSFSSRFFSFLTTHNQSQSFANQSFFFLFSFFFFRFLPCHLRLASIDRLLVCVRVFAFPVLLVSLPSLSLSSLSSSSSNVMFLDQT